MPSPPLSLPTSVEALEPFKLTNAPNSIYYIPNYISEAEETELLRRIDASPIPKWTTLSNRRLQNWGGFPHPKGMIAEPLPDWLMPYCQRISDVGVFDDDGVERRANHVLVNEYLRYRMGVGVKCEGNMSRIWYHKYGGRNLAR